MMSDSNIRADVQCPPAGRVRAVMRDMQDGAILDAGARADLNGIHVATDDRRWPDRRVVADGYFADHDGSRVDINTHSQRRGDGAIGSKRHVNRAAVITIEISLRRTGASVKLRTEVSR